VSGNPQGGKRAVTGRPNRSRTVPGLAARAVAVRLLVGVLVHKRPLDQLLAEPQTLEARDQALARAICATVLRRLGQLEDVLGSFLQQPLPAACGALPQILLTGAAQLLFLHLPAHAVVDIAVELTRHDRGAHRFVKLTNAVLRRVAERGEALIAASDGVRRNIPDWLWQAWSSAYGADTARRIAEASLAEAALDISLKQGADVQAWAERLGGRILSTGSIRLTAHGRVGELPGYADGEWWVQDAAAALVPRLLGDVSGLAVADLCAAPGGKTLALAARGAKVCAVDVSAARLGRVRENLLRLRLDAEIVEADVAQWSPGRMFDAVILDAPCAATGTIRRHPDILRLRQPQDLARLAALQRTLLTGAARLVRPGGRLIYSTCSLEPAEGEGQIEAFLAADPAFSRMPVTADEVGGDSQWTTPAGDLRTLPFHLAQSPVEFSGMDGFYAARLRRND
jgi:16S rRNA (cytosine967-C5)-methyltransferase